MAVRSLRVCAAAGVTAMALGAHVVRPGGAAERPTCGEATRVTASGARLGPVAARVGSPTGRAQVRYAVGRATKVVLVRLRPFSSTLVLRGVRCADGVPLRFAYAGERLPAPPLSKRQLETSGSAAARLRPDPYAPPPGTTFNYTGYMLFSDVGRYRITAAARGRRIGTLVLDAVAMTDR